MPGALPSPVERPFTILFGSCFAGARDTPGDAGATFARLPPDARPDLTVLCGDQVYLDTPLLHWLTRIHPPEELAAEFLANYLGTWTQAGPLSGFRRIHQLASVAFTSDDHDYWNNAPSIAPHVIDTWTEHGRTAWLEVADAAVPPVRDDDAVPVDPGRAAVGVHRRHADRADGRSAVVHGRVAVRGPADVGPRVCPGPGALVLGQPIFTAEAGLKGYIADWGLPDYRQYRDLVALLASTPHDIVVLTGDVHFGRVASCTLPGGRRIVELIASPLALVDGLVGGNWKPAPGDVPDGPGAGRAPGRGHDRAVPGDAQPRDDRRLHGRRRVRPADRHELADPAVPTGGRHRRPHHRAALRGATHAVHARIHRDGPQRRRGRAESRSAVRRTPPGWRGPGIEQGVVLLGGATLADVRVRFAQSLVRHDLTPSSWSSAALLLGDRLLTVPLDPGDDVSSVPAANAIRALPLERRRRPGALPERRRDRLRGAGRRRARRRGRGRASGSAG